MVAEGSIIKSVEVYSYSRDIRTGFLQSLENRIKFENLETFWKVWKKSGKYLEQLSGKSQDFLDLVIGETVKGEDEG